MQIAICDDNKECNDKLQNLIEEYFHNNEIVKSDIHVYTSGDDLIKEFLPQKFDIIFLDIEMPGIDGFITAQEIRELDLDVDIVFITNLKNGVQRGYDYDAKGYLYKDITKEKINELMDKLIHNKLRSNKDSLMKIKLNKGDYVLLSLSKIQYFESMSHDIIAISEKERYKFSNTITKLTSELENKGFIRVSQSYLVNIDYIFNMSGNTIVIRKGDRINIGRGYKQAIDNALKKRDTEKWKI